MKRLTPKQRVEAHLFALGYIEPRIRSNMGYWSHRHQDVCRWEGSAYHIASGRRVSVGSWDKMKDCARGIVATEGEGLSHWFAAVAPTVQAGVSPPPQLTSGSC